MVGSMLLGKMEEKEGRVEWEAKVKWLKRLLSCGNECWETGI
jgi:hypothetical protein